MHHWLGFLSLYSALLNIRISMAFLVGGIVDTREGCSEIDGLF